ncbi:MAG: lipid-binding SYLF domain-containing protein [Pirellulales bacterium]|jgi:lipid-binding SYLF domain-containing protein|nr:lipid-binding SYLF domain-containing protein [Pirellulales bacterium]
MSVRVVPSWLPKPKAIFCLLAVVALMSSGTQLRAQTSVAAGTEVQTVVAARQTLDQFFSIQIEAIPPSMLQSAAGVAIFPNMVKGGFILGVNYGKGVLHVRNQDQSWSPPVMVTMGGGSIGFQAGVQAADIVLVFKTPQSLTNILGGQKVTLGADASVAVGPVGRQANAATDARLGAEIYSYARSRGLFLGVSLGGADLSVDHNADGVLYGRYGVSPADVFNSNGITVRPEVQQLVADLNAKSGVQPSVQPSVLPVNAPGVTPASSVIPVSPNPVQPSSPQVPPIVPIQPPS